MENSLPIGIDKNRLAEMYDEFKRMPCPEAPENDDLYDIYSELMEYDGHVAGLVATFLEGKEIDKSFIIKNMKLGSSIFSFPVDSSELEAIKSYFIKLDEMIHALALIT